MSDDRRGAYRRNAFTFGAVETGAGEIGCLVWDVTETGALIEIEQAVDLPERLRVRLAPEAASREASVAWQRGKRAGIAFSG